jgi:hypothetical protein
MSPSDFSDLPFPVFHLVIPASSRIFRELKSPGFLIHEDRDILGLSTHEVYPSVRLPGRTVVSYSAFSPLSRLLVVAVKKLQQPATGTVIFCGTLCRQRMVNAVSFPLGSMALCVVPTFLHVFNHGDRTNCCTAKLQIIREFWVLLHPQLLLAVFRRGVRQNPIHERSEHRQ